MPNETNPNAFAEFFIDETTAVEIDLPNGDPMLYNGERVTVHLYGPSTPQWTAASEAKEKEATRRVLASLGQKGKNAKKDTDADARFLCAITESIDNFPFPGGTEAIYREVRLKYLYNQVSAHINDMGNFFKSSEKN